MSKYAEPGTLDESRPAFAARAYRTYLKTVYALFAGAFASRIIEEYGLHVILERDSAFGAGAVASKLSGRPLVREVIGPGVSHFSTTIAQKILAYNKSMVPEDCLDRTVFVRAAVNLDLFKPDNSQRDTVRSELGLGDSTVVGYVGTFQAWHGVADFIEAARMVHDRLGDVKFLLVGPMPRAVESLIRSRDLSRYLIVAGTVPYELVPSFINAADVLVAPYNTLISSRRAVGIGSPLKVLEYMACGKPTVGSFLPQVAEIIDEGVTGFLVPEGAPGVLAEKIMRLATDSELRSRIGKNAVEKVRKEFSWLTLARKIQDLLEDCAYAKVA
jgi:glycosyltransferase involved in cell wall biosynthesis